MHAIGLILFYFSIVSAIPLFFVKTERSRMILLYLSIGTFAFSWIIFLTEFFMPEGYFTPSYYMRDLSWVLSFHMEDLISALMIGGGVLLLIGAGFFISKKRGLKQTEPYGESQASPPNQSYQLAGKATPMFGVRKILSVVLVSLFGILMLIFAREVIIERYQSGLPVNLPDAAYGKLISWHHDYDHLSISVGSNGQISDSKRMFSAKELYEHLVNEVRDRPRVRSDFIDAKGHIRNRDYVDNLVVHLRVDAQCPFDKLHNVLLILESNHIRYAYFKVGEE